MDEAEAVSALIGDIYDAVLDPALWRAVLAKCARFVGGSAASIYWKDTASKRGSATYDDGVIDPYYRQLYFEKYIKFDPTSTGLFFAGIGEPQATADIVPYDEFLETRFYREWARPQGLVDFLNGVLDKSATSLAAFVVFRHERDGLADDATRRRMRLITPHLRRAVQIGKVIDVEQAEAATFGDILDGLSAGMFLVDASGRIVHANTAAVRSSSIRISSTRRAAGWWHAMRRSIRPCTPCSPLPRKAMQRSAWAASRCRSSPGRANVTSPAYCRCRPERDAAPTSPTPRWPHCSCTRRRWTVPPSRRASRGTTS